jgi:hypothetical protein
MGLDVFFWNRKLKKENIIFYNYDSKKLIIEYNYILLSFNVCMASIIVVVVHQRWIGINGVYVCLSGVGEPNHFTAAKCTVSIDDQIIEVDSGPFNIRQIFGDEAILVDSSGQLVLTDEWGVTLDSLQHGASYFLVCILSYSNYFVNYIFLY